VFLFLKIIISDVLVFKSSVFGILLKEEKACFIILAKEKEQIYKRNNLS